MDDAELRALLAAQAKLITELSERIAPTRPVLPLRVLYDSYETAQKHRPGWRSCAAMLSPFVAMFTARDCAGLQAADWTTYRVSRPELAASSLNYSLRMAKAMLRWGKQQGHLAAVPQLCEEKSLPAKKHRETAPTERDNLAMLSECSRAMERYIVLAAVDAGLRNGEIRRLERSWVDREKMQIHLPAVVAKGTDQSRKARSVPLTKRLLAAIDSIPRDIRSPLVLVSPRTGGPLCQTWVTWIFEDVAQRAGVKAVPGEGKVRCHDGRHGFATEAHARGVKLRAIQKALGHASLQQTADYIGDRDDDLEQATKDFEAGISDRG